MKLSISNIAWQEEQDAAVYELMKKYGFTGLEIAPTRIFSQNPYEDLKKAKEWKEALYQKYGFTVPSMQSIWFGKTESIFGNEEDKKVLLDYTYKAIDFARTTDCKNLVFGCPRNRNVPEGANKEEAIPFFKELAKYALKNNTVIGMEANPPMYNTNFINDTMSAFALIDSVDSAGFKLNLDIGTMIANAEHADVIKDKVHLINHVHFSEPGLKRIEERKLHEEIIAHLQAGGYQGFVSVEMGKQDNLKDIETVMSYMQGLMGK